MIGDVAPSARANYPSMFEARGEELAVEQSKVAREKQKESGKRGEETVK